MFASENYSVLLNVQTPASQKYTNITWMTGRYGQYCMRSGISHERRNGAYSRGDCCHFFKIPLGRPHQHRQPICGIIVPSATISHAVLATWQSIYWASMAGPPSTSVTRVNMARMIKSGSRGTSRMCMKRSRTAHAINASIGQALRKT